MDFSHSEADILKLSRKQNAFLFEWLLGQNLLLVGFDAAVFASVKDSGQAHPPSKCNTEPHNEVYGSVSCVHKNSGVNCNQFLCLTRRFAGVKQPTYEHRDFKVQTQARIKLSIK